MIAELGLAINSAPAKEATVNLDKFANAAKAADASAAKLAASAKGVSDTTIAITQAMNPANDKVVQFDQAAKKLRDTHGGLSTQAMALQHAMRGSVEMLAQGVPPTQILAMEMNHLAFAMSGPKGLKGAFDEVTGGVARLVGPTGLIVGGIAGGLALATGVAYAYYRSVTEPAVTAEQALTEQARIIGLVKDAYRDAKIAAGQFNTEVKSALLLEAKVNLSNLQTQLTDFAKNFRDKAPTSDLVIFAGEAPGPPPEIANKFTPFKKAIDDFVASAKAGKPDVDAFEESVGRLGLSNPAFSKAGHDLLESARAAEDFNAKIKQVQASIKMLEGHGTAADRSMLGLSEGTTHAAKAYDNLVRATQDQIAEFQFQAQNAGTSASQIEGLKKEHELLREAVKSGIGVDQQRADSIHALSARLTEAAQAAAVAKAKFSDDFARQMLGLSDAEQRVAQAMQQLYGRDWPAHMNDALAAQMRLTDALGQTKGMATDFMRSFNSDVMNGTVSMNTLASAVRNLGMRFLEIAENDAISMLFRNMGGGGGLLGLLGLGGGGGGGSVSAGAGLDPTGFANGGVMTSSGPLQLRRYSSGGIANSPQIAMFGEGSGPEAYVPLPDGRSIPVSIRAPKMGGGAPVFAPVYNIDARGSNMTQAQFEAILDKRDQQLRKELPTHIAAYNQDPRSR